MSESLDLQRRATLALASYENAGREITQAFSTLNFNTALAAGVLATVLGTVGAGELFAGNPGDPLATQDPVPSLSVVSNFVLALSAPLLFRFFLRTVLGYQNLIRFNRIQREAWNYLAGHTSWEAFSFNERMYGSVDEWRSPMSLARLVKSNLEYGYFWIFFALGAPLVWSYVSIWDDVAARWVSLSLLGTAATWEIVLFVSHRMPFFKTLSDEEGAELKHLETLPPDPPLSNLDSAKAGEVVEEARGLFVGSRRIRRDLK